LGLTPLKKETRQKMNLLNIISITTYLSLSLSDSFVNAQSPADAAANSTATVVATTTIPLITPTAAPTPPADLKSGVSSPYQSSNGLPFVDVNS
jgi:hypothetical protein